MKSALVGVEGLRALLLSPTLSWAQSEEPTKWEQLFFPFPIVGAMLSVGAMGTFPIERGDFEERRLYGY